MQITADHRESQAGVIEFLQKRDQVTVVMDTLKAGDYRVEKNVLFERKTLLDFAESIKDGRLFRQAERLSMAPEKAAFIIEGKSNDLAHSKMSRESMQGALISLSLIWGIPVLRSLDAEETARLMIYTGNQLQWMAQGGIKRSGYRPKTKHKRQLYILQGLPGIGPERAERLIGRFGSVAGIAQASSHDIAALEGFGEKTAQKIYDAVHEEQAGYGANDVCFPEL
ncbi:MAG: ERCC4 domain-containing protein [Kiritimatiellae bacterium]|nr:ERCC4 domain-containing protein [Kiritimatiellia bacterium]